MPCMPHGAHVQGLYQERCYRVNMYATSILECMHVLQVLQRRE